MTNGVKHIVNVSNREGLRVDIEAGEHRLILDEPTDVGGTNLGPTPYDYLLTSLGG